MMSNVTEITDSDFEKAVQAKDFAIVDVYTSWCGSCSMFAPFFGEVAASHSDVAAFYKIDAENNPAFCEQVPIDNLPYVAVFLGGKFVGGQSTTKKEALEETLGMIRKKAGS